MNYLIKSDRFISRKISKYFGTIKHGENILIKRSNASMKSTRQQVLVWDFDLRLSEWRGDRSYKKGVATGIDFYVLVGLKDNKPVRAFIMPGAEVTTTHVRIPVEGKSKYYKYVI